MKPKLPDELKAKVREQTHKAACFDDLLAALERSEQYLIVAIHDGRHREPKLSAATIKTAESDLEMVRAAIAKAKDGKG